MYDHSTILCIVLGLGLMVGICMGYFCVLHLTGLYTLTYLFIYIYTYAFGMYIRMGELIDGLGCCLVNIPGVVCLRQGTVALRGRGV